MDNYSQEELKNLLGAVGTNVRIHKSVVFFNPKQIYISSNVRIDCFCMLSAGEEGIHIDDYIHIGVGSYFFGSGGKIILESFSNISSRVSLFTMNDDYVEGHMSNPMIPADYKKLAQGPIKIGKHAIVGSGSIILPDVEIGLGASVGALSLVKNNVDSFEIVCGIPAKKKGVRKQGMLELEKSFLAN